jgi:hypothetical protein
VILIHMSTLKTQNQTRVKIITIRKNNHHCHYNKNRVRSGDHGHRLTKHVSISVQVVTEEKKQNQAQHIRIHHLYTFPCFILRVTDLLVM